MRAVRGKKKAKTTLTPQRGEEKGEGSIHITSALSSGEGKGDLKKKRTLGMVRITTLQGLLLRLEKNKE